MLIETVYLKWDVANNNRPYILNLEGSSNEKKWVQKKTKVCAFSKIFVLVK